MYTDFGRRVHRLKMIGQSYTTQNVDDDYRRQRYNSPSGRCKGWGYNPQKFSWVGHNAFKHSDLF